MRSNVKLSVFLAAAMSVVLVALATESANARAVPVSGGTYEIRAHHSNKCLDVAHGSTIASARVLQANCSGGLNQKWRLGGTGAGYYNLVPLHSNLCIGVESGGYAHNLRIAQFRCSGVPSQQWKFTLRNVYGAYQVRARHSNKCLDVTHASVRHGTGVIQGDCHGGRNQRWSLFITSP